MNLEYTTKKYPLMRAHDTDAGIDLRYYERSIERVTFIRGTSTVLSTGVRVAIPPGYVGLLCLRSSLAKKGLRLSNGVGIIDSGYRGQIGVMVYYEEEGRLIIYEGDRIAQLVVVPCPAFQPLLVGKLDVTERGIGGFGSTGV